MAIDRRLLEILCCPTSKVPLDLLGKADLALLNAQIEAGTLSYIDGESVAAAVSAALITKDRRSLYLIDDDIPVLLPERAIAALSVGLN